MVEEKDVDARDEELLHLRERVRELEEQLTHSRSASAFLESVLEAVPAFITNLDPDLKIRFLNRYQSGHSFETSVGRDVFDYIAESDRARVREHIDRARATGQTVSYVVHDATGPDGQPASYVTRVAPVREPDGRIGACLAFMDITEERKTERTLRETQEKLALALDATGLGLWSWEIESDQVVWDERMLALHGATAALKPDAYVATLVHPEDRAYVAGSLGRGLEAGKFSQSVFRILRPDGGVRWVVTAGRIIFDEHGQLSRVMGGSLDVTHQRELEEQLRKSQRMAAITSLTAGIAHNFNNMLAVILPILDFASGVVAEPHRPMLDDAIHAALRAAELVEQLMTYAGQAKNQSRGIYAVDDLVQAAANICRRAYPAHIELRVEPALVPVNVLCNAGQIEQVLVNLLLNARDAVDAAAAPRGQVRVRVCIVADAASGRTEVCIDVADNGAGVSDEAMAHLFEPFFTTKGVGKGTGLGLATSYGIARDHHGRLSCVSTSAQGTTFRLALPVEKTTGDAVPPEPGVACRGVRLLLVDDDVAVRSALSLVLGSLGAVVRQAESGQQALNILREEAVDAIVLDRSMPSGAGETFVPSMRELLPGIPIVFLSGHSIEPEVAARADAVVLKPVTGRALLEVIGQMLSARAS